MNEKYPEVKTALTKLFKQYGFTVPTIRKGKVDKLDAFEGKITICPYRADNVELHAKTLFLDYLLIMSRRGDTWMMVIRNGLIGAI